MDVPEPTFVMSTVAEIVLPSGVKVAVAVSHSVASAPVEKTVATELVEAGVSALLTAENQTV